jgi:hypothetical protein
MVNKLFAIFVMCALYFPAQAYSDLEVIYPAMEERPIDSYGYKGLALALEKSGRKYHLSISKNAMNSQRARRSIDDGTISVLDAGTSAEFEKKYSAIYFPIDRGLSGYRLFIINKNLAPEFAAIKSLDDLQKKVAGQGAGWADIKILEGAGIKVVTGEFVALFKMVDRRRFDFYPLGIEEIYSLYDKYRGACPDSIIENTLTLHYPFARLFFVRKDNKDLHDALMEGLEKAFADGSFQDLINKDASFRELQLRANIKNRTIIEVDNPNLTPQFRQIPAKYFIKPLINSVN